jgi:hypothetical protein
LQQNKAALEMDTRHAVYENQKAQVELSNLRGQLRKARGAPSKSTAAIQIK